MSRKVIKVDTVKGVDLYLPATDERLAQLEQQAQLERNKHGAQPTEHQKIEGLTLEGGE